MYIGSIAASIFAERFNVRYTEAVGMIVLMKELDGEYGLDGIPDGVLWNALGGKIRRVSADELAAAYHEYVDTDKRSKARERQQKHRECHADVTQMSRSKRDKKCDTSVTCHAECHTKSVTGESSPFSPSPAPFLPPSTPTPPVTPYNPPNPNPITPTCGGGYGPAAATLEAYASGNLQYMSPRNMEELDSFREDLPEDVIRYAIDEACANGKRTWAYVKAILNRYVQDGVKSIGDIRDREQKREKSANKSRVIANNPALAYEQRTHTEDDYAGLLINLDEYDGGTK